MKRLFITTFLIIFSVITVGIAVAQINRATCFRHGVLPRSFADAEVEIGGRIFRESKSEWAALGVSEPELLRAINILEINGPAMNFEHASTRYVSLELTVCPAIEMPIALGFHCEKTANLGWIARRCQRDRG
ncbi:hypothetical protein [Ruegeria sp. MALMAid1280]|uniref:hypothetical protein n=1 Tax=Ruegeria sp. MALMAid1280 TaxID=3411634 RepID=UPI003BA35D03